MDSICAGSSSSRAQLFGKEEQEGKEYVGALKKR